ncbi:MAG: hypothetical protein EXR55_05185 [Dehalococcoidia bacterium]|nr:hypothetical protein [Dehalococcoidia bacterium]
MRKKQAVMGLALVVIGLMVGVVGAYLVVQPQLSSTRAEVSRLGQELESLRLASRVVITLLPGADDNAPLASEWSGQTGRIRYALASTKGFDYIVEMENMPADRKFYVYFSIGPPGEKRLIRRVGEVTIDTFGRATLSGLISLDPGVYQLGNFISHVDSAAPPYTNRTWMCIREAVSFEVVSS